MQDLIMFIEHHAGLSAGLFIVLILLMIVEFMKNKRGTERLSPQQLVQMMNHKNATLVDIRTTERFTQGHIVGAMSIPLSTLKEKLKKLEKAKNSPIVITCELGHESPRAIALLAKSALAPLFILKGGIRAWREADLPLVKD